MRERYIKQLLVLMVAALFYIGYNYDMISAITNTHQFITGFMFALSGALIIVIVFQKKRITSAKYWENEAREEKQKYESLYWKYLNESNRLKAAKLKKKK